MWLLGTGAIKEILTPERAFTGSGDDKLMMSIIFGMATKDIDDLRKNICRGNKQALLQGLWPGAPKIGYLRDRSTMKLIADPVRLPLIKEAFRLRRQGVPMSEILDRARNEWHLTTPVMRSHGGKLISQSLLYRTLRDPFYAGMMVRKEGSFPGTHPAAVSWVEFEEVQEQFKRLGTSEPRPKTNLFPYRGLLRCGACSSVITAERKVNRFGSRYTYYHCCRKSRAYGYCAEPSIEHEALEDQLRTVIEGLTLPPDVAEAVLDELENVRAEVCESESRAIQTVEAQLTRNDEKLRNLRHLAAEGRITGEELDEDRRLLTQEQIGLRAQLERAHPALGLIEPLIDGISIAVTAKKSFEDGEPEKKREVCQALFSNLVLNQKTLLVEAKFPFQVSRDLAQLPDVCTARREVRTLVQHSLRPPCQ
jgi:site-specific DNA recombinase